MTQRADLSATLEQRITELGTRLTAKKYMLATAESCTGGLIGALLTSVSGSSNWYAGGIISYANHVKQGVLGVPQEVLATYGAVSEATVLAMAKGATQVLGTQCAISVSGIAGPTGGTPEKPVGTVWIGFATPHTIIARHFLFAGDRDAVRRQTAEAAITTFLDSVL